MKVLTCVSDKIGGDHTTKTTNATRKPTSTVGTTTERTTTEGVSATSPSRAPPQRGFSFSEGESSAGRTSSVCQNSRRVWRNKVAWCHIALNADFNVLTSCTQLRPDFGFCGAARVDGFCRTALLLQTAPTGILPHAAAAVVVVVAAAAAGEASAASASRKEVRTEGAVTPHLQLVSSTALLSSLLSLLIVWFPAAENHEQRSACNF